MLNEVIISDIGKIIVFLLGILSVYLLSARTKRNLPNYIFASFLIVTAIDLTGLFLKVPNSQILRNIKISSVLLQMPLYFLYVKSACYYNFKLQKTHLIHGILFVVFLLLFFSTAFSEFNLRLFKIASSIQYYFYIISVFYALHTFKNIYQNNYSGHHEITYNWLFKTTILFLTGNTFVTIREFVNSNHPFLFYLNLFISVFALLVICWFVGLF